MCDRCLCLRNVTCLIFLLVSLENTPQNTLCGHAEGHLPRKISRHPWGQRSKIKGHTKFTLENFTGHILPKWLSQSKNYQSHDARNYRSQGPIYWSPLPLPKLAVTGSKLLVTRQTIAVTTPKSAATYTDERKCQSVKVFSMLRNSTCSKSVPEICQHWVWNI